MPDPHYDEDYYLRGPQTGKSNYENYGWKPDLTLPMADHLKRVLHIKDDDTVLDFGCARGFLVKALRMRGVEAYGCDSSEWAVANCDEGVTPFITQEIPDGRFDHIIAKDVFEHIQPPQLAGILVTLLGSMRKSLLAIVPLSAREDDPYLRPEDNADPSHAIRWPLEEWLSFFHRCLVFDPNVIVTGSWHYPGLKPASSEVPKSCGFIQITRVS